jgi:hypothetical protein
VEPLPELSTYVGGMTAFAPVEHPRAALYACLHLRNVQDSIEREKAASQQEPGLRFAILTIEPKVHGANADEQPQHFAPRYRAEV